MNTEKREADTLRLVSETYRELPAERTPEHLNRAVLNRAAGEMARSRGYRFVGWLKPAAWTGVIALSLALLIELAEIQTQSIPEPITPVSPPASKSELRTEKSATDREFTKIQPAQEPDARERAESIAKPMAQKAGVAPTGCDDVTRASPNDWMECIRKLRESGDIEVADREYEAFILEYPPK